MKWLPLRLLIFALIIIFIGNKSVAQCGVPTYVFGGSNPFNNSIVNLACGQNCTDIKFQVPHIKASSDYIVTSIPYLPLLYTTPGGNELTNLYVDDVYGPVINMPFKFCFYDSLFDKCVMGSNGLLTFDIANAEPCGNSWQMTQPIPFSSNNICSNGAPYYPKSSIMGVFGDLFPVSNASPPDRKIEWHIEGAPGCRRFVASYYHVGMFGLGNYSPTGSNCNSLNPTTFQIVLYESSGLIEIFVENKTCVATSSAPTIMGVQDWTRTKAVAAPGKNATVWSETNTGYRFIPSAGQSRYISSELLTITNTHVAWADTTTTVAGALDISFPNICTTGPSTQFIIRTFFSSCEDPSNLLFSLDTITVNRTLNLNATATNTPTACGPPTGTITVTTPTGVGTAPFSYTLDGGASQPAGANPFTINNVSSGAHTVYVTDASGCSSTLTVNVGLNGTLTLNANTTATSCVGVNNGVITVTPPAGTAPFQYSINGLPPQASNIFPNVSAGSYTIVVNDAAGCTGTITVSVAGGPGINANTAFTPTTCAGANNGTITVTAVDGTAPYQYSIDGLPYQASNIFNAVAAGSHNIIMRDVNGCTTAVITVVVPAGAAINGTAATTPTSCAGVNNGSITVTPGGGTGPYQYSLDGLPYQAGNVFTNVSGGGHTVVFQDAIGCVSANIPANVATGAAPVATIVATPTSCAGVNNGSITVTPTSGSAPYQYSLDGGTYQAGNIFTNVTAGPHIVTFIDAFNCTSANYPVNVTNGAGITGTAAFTSTSCNGAADGTITVTATSGTAPYQYSLDGGTYQTGNVFTNVSSGNHTVVFRDVNGCTSANIAVNVTAGPSLAGTATPTQTSCTGINNGTITVNATSGTAPYQYSLDGGTYQAGNVFTNVAAGNHTIVFRDANGCSSSNIAVTVTAGAGVTGTAVATATSCPGINNATITVTAVGGLFPDQFSLDGAPAQPGNIFTGVGTGNHIVVITDAAGCSSGNIAVTVTAGPALNVNVAATNTSCNGANNGSITLTATNGTGPYQYTLNALPAQPANVFNNLAPGNYTMTVTDNNGCAANNLATTINAGAGLTATLNTTNILCNGGFTGSITVNLTSAATPPVQYSLDNVNFQGLNVFNGMPAGIHTVYFKDNLGCTGSQTVTLTQPAALSLNIITQPVRCNGQSNGVIAISVSGGTGPYQYSLDNINFLSTATFNVVAGTYTVYVRDINNCSVSQAAVNITQPAVLTATAATTNASCSGGADGVINVTAGGGVAAYQYSINGTTFQASNIFNVIPGPYTVTVRDVNNCTTTVNATVALTNNLTFTPGNDTTICEGTSAQLHVTTNATQFSWTHAADLNSASIPNPVASPIVSTQYIVTATLGNCSTTGTINVTVNPAPFANAGLPNIEICYGQDAQLSASGGVSYQWTPPTYLSNASVPNPTVVRPQQSIQYSLQVTDGNGCKSLIPAAATVTVTPPIKVVVTPRDTIATEGDQIQLNAISIATNYSWSNGATLSNPNISNPVATMPSGSLGATYVYTVTASTAAGCTGTATSVIVKVYKGPDLYVPSAFTPNGDGMNEVFRGIPVGIKKLNYFRIYNRAGHLLFTTSELNKGWDGTYKGIQQPPGVYVWIAEGLTKDDKPVSKRGTVVLIR